MPGAEQLAHDRIAADTVAAVLDVMKEATTYA